MVVTADKRKYMEKVSNEAGIISALAFDQRGALKNDGKTSDRRTYSGADGRTKETSFRGINTVFFLNSIRS